jgi:hypothetical protein
MTTTDPKVLHFRWKANDQAANGVHGNLVIVEVPAGAEALIGTYMKDATITINGDYVCLIPLGGLASSLKVTVTPVLDSMTASSSGPDELTTFDPKVTDVADAVVLTAGTGDGALTTATAQTASLTLTGALYARYTLTAGASPTSITFTTADYVGL